MFQSKNEKRWHNGLKAQHCIAQGNALGSRQKGNLRPERAKVYKHSTLDYRLLPLQGVWLHINKTPGRCPGLCSVGLSARQYIYSKYRHNKLDTPLK